MSRLNPLRSVLILFIGSRFYAHGDACIRWVVNSRRANKWDLPTIDDSIASLVSDWPTISGDRTRSLLSSVKDERQNDGSFESTNRIESKRLMLLNYLEVEAIHGANVDCQKRIKSETSVNSVRVYSSHTERICHSSAKLMALVLAQNVPFFDSLVRFSWTDLHRNCYFKAYSSGIALRCSIG